jgi:hypothetical protein
MVDSPGNLDIRSIKSNMHIPITVETLPLHSVTGVVEA